MGGGLDDTLFGDFPSFERFRAYTSGILRFNRKTMELRPLREGSQVVAGTLLGRVGDSGGLAPHLNFSIRPAGRGAPTIDPKPILDGWKLLEATALYRVADKDPFATDASSISEVLLLSKEQLARRVLADPSLEIYECGRQDIATGQIDRRHPGDARVPGRPGLHADDHLAQVRALDADRRRATSASTRSAARSTSPRSTACR